MLPQMYWEVMRLLFWLSLMGFSAPKCLPERCGSMNVSFPFWIDNLNCGFRGFQIKCKENFTGQLVPFLTAFVESNTGDMNIDFEILKIDYAGSLIINSTSLKATSCNETDDAFVRFMLPQYGPFTISSVNKFVVIGCRAIGSFRANMSEWSDASCRSACINQYDPKYCNTYGCCEARIPGNWTMINFTGGGGCGFSTILDTITWTLPHESDYGIFGKGRYSLTLDWSIGQWNCSTANGTSKYSCAKQAECMNENPQRGHVCKCLPGYDGNGYSNGTDCTDVDECSNTNECVAPREGGKWHNFEGYYNCSCAKGYTGDGFENGTRCQSTSSNNSVMPAIIGSVSSFVVVSLVASVLIWWLKKRHLKLVEAKYFQQLQQYIVSRVGRETLRMFSARELERTCKNYSNDMELGSGGFGTVYKGTLLDGTIVAIKMSKQVLNL